MSSSRAFVRTRARSRRPRVLRRWPWPGRWRVCASREASFVGVESVVQSSRRPREAGHRTLGRSRRLAPRSGEGLPARPADHPVGRCAPRFAGDALGTSMATPTPRDRLRLTLADARGSGSRRRGGHRRRERRLVLTATRARTPLGRARGPSSLAAQHRRPACSAGGARASGARPGRNRAAHPSAPRPLRRRPPRHRSGRDRDRRSLRASSRRSTRMTSPASSTSSLPTCGRSRSVSSSASGDCD